jgi:hypothetical protein
MVVRKKISNNDNVSYNLPTTFQLRLFDSDQRFVRKNMIAKRSILNVVSLSLSLST